jgi:beta-galactosidase
MRTTEKASMLSMSADRPTVRPDGIDLIYITVQIEDRNKLLVPRSNNLVNFAIEGPGKIVAVDNGDATSHEPFQANYRKAYNGMCLVIVKADKGAKGSFNVKATSKGLKEATVKINVAN